MSFFGGKKAPPAQAMRQVIYVPQPAQETQVTAASAAQPTATDEDAQVAADKLRRDRARYAAVTSITGPMGVIGEATLGKSSLLGSS